MRPCGYRTCGRQKATGFPETVCSYFLPGIVAFRQHLQNLARTKGILELNKVQLLYEQMGPEVDADAASAGPQLRDLASSCPQVSAAGPPGGPDGSPEPSRTRGVSSGGFAPALRPTASREASVGLPLDRETAHAGHRRPAPHGGRARASRVRSRGGVWKSVRSAFAAPPPCTRTAAGRLRLPKGDACRHHFRCAVTLNIIRGLCMLKIREKCCLSDKLYLEAIFSALKIL